LALENYGKGKKLAEETGNDDLINKIDKTILEIKNQHSKDPI